LQELIAKHHATEAFLIAEVDSSLIYTKVDPELKSLHRDPRFAALLKKLNLPN